MKRWVELTDEYTSKIKHLTRKKIRLPESYDNEERTALWDANEKCFFWAQGECAAYMDEPDNRPTHIMVG